MFLENNAAGVIREWWCHVPTTYWFIAERNTVTDEIIQHLSGRRAVQAARRIRRQAEAGRGLSDDRHQPPARRPHGRLIDRSRPIAFTFEGRASQGFAGDTIASALAANDAWMLSRSFKYHRPRGVLTMAGQDANTLVQVGDEPNVLADRRADRRRASRSPARTMSAASSTIATPGSSMFGRFLPVGFYYKAFYRPRGAWKFWEPLHPPHGRPRHGRTPHAHHGYFDKDYLFADVAVIGGGPAGLAAALAAAKRGAEVAADRRERRSSAAR